MKANVKLEHQLLAVEAEHELHAMLELTSPTAPQTARQPRVPMLFSTTMPIACFPCFSCATSTALARRCFEMTA